MSAGADTPVDRGALFREYLRLWSETSRRSSTRKERGFMWFTQAITEPVRLAGARPLETPATVTWEITRTCNLLCEYCYIDARAERRPGELTTEEALALVDQMADCNVLSVAIEGGEPFLYPGLFTVLERLKRHRIAVSILTNGTRINAAAAERLRALLEPEIDYIQVSLDASNPAVQDKMDRAGSFDQAVRGLRALSTTGLDVGVNMVVTSSNVHEIIPTYRFVHEIPGVCGFNVSPAFASGRATSLPPLDRYTLVGEYVELYRLAESSGGPAVAARLGHSFDLPEYREVARAAGAPPVETHYCTACRSEVCVDFDGSVYGCHFLLYPELCLGNVRQAHLADLWRSSLARRIGEGRSASAECRRCDIGRFCNKKCMGFAYAVHRDLDAKDPNCPYDGLTCR